MGVVSRLNPTGWAVVILAIGIWEALVRAQILRYASLPAPSGVLSGFGDLVASGALLGDLLHTLGVAVLASALAIAIGVTLGAAIGLVPLFAALTNASVDVLRTIPTLALIPVALLIFGPEFRTELIVAVYAATWPVLINTAGGVRAVHPRLYDVARTFQLSGPERLRKIVLPAAMPAILVGGRLAVVSALVVAVVAEMLVNPEGIGWGLIRTQQALRPERTWAYAIASGALGFAVNACLVFAVRRALPGGQDNRAVSR
jgi:ABC-type nitrate/sulfonate/bicarbonate transport system permease component